MKELYLQLALLASITLDATQDDATLKLAFEDAFKKLIKDAGISQSLQTQIADLTTKVSTLEAEKLTNAEKLTQAELGIATLADLRTETQRVYSLIKNGTPDPAIVNTINTVDHTTLKALHTQYTEQLEQAFPMECSSCHGTSMTRRKSAITDPLKKDTEVKQFSEIVKGLAEKKRKAKAPAFLTDTTE